jgi:hypothetical protein
VDATAYRPVARVTPGLRETLARVADAAAGAAEPWWIIGSAAVALHGRAGEVREDVDVLTGPAGARRFLQGFGIEAAPGEASALFRSEVFGRWDGAPLAVEVMGGLHLRTGGGWQPVRIETRQAVNVEGRTLYIPAAEELARLFTSFGRPKDVERAKQLLG